MQLNLSCGNFYKEYYFIRQIQDKFNCILLLFYINVEYLGCISIEVLYILIYIYNTYRFIVSYPAFTKFTIMPWLGYPVISPVKYKYWAWIVNYWYSNVENSIKREMRKNTFSTKNFNTYPPPPPRDFFFLHQFLFNLGNSMKREENMKFWKKKKSKLYFFKYFKNS